MIKKNFFISRIKIGYDQVFDEMSIESSSREDCRVKKTKERSKIKFYIVLWSVLFKLSQ